jgi:curved DNA-binding protein CbpA
MPVGTAEKELVVEYTHYDYLDLPPGASAARIEAAYQNLRQRLNGHSDPALIRMINAAYLILSDASLRQAYDTQLQATAAEADRELRADLDAQVTRLPRRVQDVPAPLIAAVSAWAA